MDRFKISWAVLGLSVATYAAAGNAEVSVVVRNASGQQLSNATCTLQGSGLQTTSSSVQLTVSDNCIDANTCTPAYQVSPTSLTIGQGKSTTFSVALACAPASAITVTAASLNSSIATVSPSSVSLSDTNARTFTVTASSTNSGTTKIDLNGSASYASNNIADVNVSVSNLCADPYPNNESDSNWVVDASCGYGSPLQVLKGISGGSIFLPLRDRFTGTYRDGEIWTVRHNFDGGGDLYFVTIDKAEGGETSASYDGAFSRIPGSFTETLDANGNRVSLPAACLLTNKTVEFLYLAARQYAGTTYCPLDVGKTYYFNTRVSGTQNCGVGTKQCRMKTFTTIPY